MLKQIDFNLEKVALYLFKTIAVEEILVYSIYRTYILRSWVTCRRAFPISQNIFVKTIDSTIRKKSISRSKCDNCSL